MSLVVDATIHGFKKRLHESNIDIGGVCYHEGLHVYFYEKDGFEKTVQTVIDKSLESPEWLLSYFKNAVQKSTELRVYTEKFISLELEKESDEKLLGYLKGFAEGFYDMYTYGTVPILIGYSENNPLYARMNSILEEKLKGKEDTMADYLVDVTKPPATLKPQQQELAILKIAKDAKKEGIQTVAEIKKEYPKELQELVSLFGWLSYDLCDTSPYDTEYFATLVEERIHHEDDEVNEKVREIEGYEEQTKERIGAIYSELSLDADEQKVFDLIRMLGYYKWLREYEFLQATYNIRFVQEEFGRRCGLSTKESKYVLIEEMEEALNSPEVTQKKIKERLNALSILVDREKKVIEAGSKAQEEFERLQFEEETVDLETNEIKGTPAKSGKVKGAVKIVNIVDDIPKMDASDILVSQATNPDLIPAMKKAGAVVTNEGGITCHAAIVSRELGIPCVVGTKVATKVLKDGYVVEVDANIGVVKILER